MSFAQMEFVFNLPKVSNTQTLRTFYLMYVFQKGGIQRLKIDIYANFIFIFFFFFRRKKFDSGTHVKEMSRNSSPFYLI